MKKQSLFNFIYSKETKGNRLIVKIFGINFSHKLNRSKKKNIYVLIKKNGKRIYNPKIKGISVKYRGGHNIVKIHESDKNSFKNVKIYLENNDFVEIKPTENSIWNLTITSLGRTKTFIDEKFSIAGGDFFIDYGSNLTIKNDCMFSSNIILKTGDAHTIYDGNNKTLNGTADIVIGNHVWIGLGCKILKRTVIPDGSIVGIGSMTTKPFAEKNCIYAGTPAKLAKTNIAWDRKAYSEIKFEKSENSYIEKLQNRFY